MTDDEEGRREKALQLAIAAKAFTHNAEEIVEAAKKFETFLKGEKNV